MALLAGCSPALPASSSGWQLKISLRSSKYHQFYLTTLLKIRITLH